MSDDKSTTCLLCSEPLIQGETTRFTKDTALCKYCDHHTHLVGVDYELAIEE